jgi:hypothetical protein
VGKSWQDEIQKTYTVKGERLIMIHAGEENGFVKYTLLM